jgi:anti-anti-sigma factor
MEELRPQSEAPLSVETIIETPDVPVVVLAGELDSSNVGILEQRVAQLTATPPARIAFDLAGLRFMDSAGIAVLISTAAAVPVVEVRNPSAIVRRVLEASGLSKLLRIAP